MKIHESSENYLEAVLVLQQQNGEVRSIDIAHHLELSKPSVSRAVGLLKDGGYITMDKEGWLELTQTGCAIAERMYERHLLMTDWLVSLGVSPQIAAEDACKIEHDISEETFDKIKEHIHRSK